jgi:hypothetical protein
MQHLDEGTIHAWLDGALPAMEAREVEQHVAECSECSAMVAEARGLIAGASRVVASLDVVRGNVIPKKPAAGTGKSVWHSLRQTPARAALAPTLIIPVSTMFTVRHDTAEKLVPPAASPNASAPAANAPAAADARSPAPAPTAPSTTVPTVASSEPAKQAAAPKMKDRSEVANKPKEEARADLATSATAAAPPAVQVPPLAAAGASSANLLDTNFKKTLAKATEVDSVRSGREQARRFAPSLVEQRAVPPLNTACFQFAEAPGFGVPQRFALQLLPGDTAQHIVRAVNESGRLDSLLTGSSWTRASPTEVTVRFASNNRTVTLPIPDATLGAVLGSADERPRARQAGPSVSRVVCRP